jgi:hypothetical protein
VYLEGCRNLIAAFPGVRLLFTSSTSVYAQTDGAAVTEESAAEPVDAATAGKVSSNTPLHQEIGRWNAGVRSAAMILGMGALALASARGQIPEARKAIAHVDFEGSPALGYVEDGFCLRGPEDGAVALHAGGGIAATNGSKYLRIGRYVAPLTLTHADGLEFDLISLDLAEYSTVAIPPVALFEGIKRDGSVVNFSFTPDGIIDGSGPNADFQTITFPPDWTDLVKVQVLSEVVAIDHVVLKGLILPDIHAHGDRPPVPLEVIGTISEDASYNSWSVENVVDGKPHLIRPETWNSSGYAGIYDPARGDFEWTSPLTSYATGNRWTREKAWVVNGELMVSDAEGSRVIARVGQDNVDGIAFPAVSNGKVIFVNRWYHQEESYAVFMASDDGVIPVVTPSTVLPDGGLPHYYPDAMHFVENTFAFETSTTKSMSKSRYVVGFNGGPLQMTPGLGDKVPGTERVIERLIELYQLNNESITLLVETGDNPQERQYLIRMDSDGGLSATTPGDLYLKTPLPGTGCVERLYGVAGYDPGQGEVLSFGPMECNDLGPNNLNGISIQRNDGQRLLLVRESSIVPGFGRLLQVSTRAAVLDGRFYVTAMNEAGAIAILKGTIPSAPSKVSAGSFVPTTDGSVRFMVENLTHGQSYRVERSPTPAGPWTESSRFTGGSPARSVLGNFERVHREFFRVVEE